MSEKKSPSIISYGEMLWDLLPTGKSAGGAPMNVTYHAQNLGLNAQLISKVGNDTLGIELIDFLGKKGIKTHFVSRDDIYNTGTVEVALDDNGSPTYQITEPVAWDYIGSDDTMLEAVSKADALVYGSLASRSSRSSSTLFELIEKASTKVFDVNLRAPFYSKDLLLRLLKKADLVKMNIEELDIISDWFTDVDGDMERGQAVLTACNLDLLIVTKGADGAIAITPDKVFSVHGVAVKVQDTIGSGDSFLAGFLSQYLFGKSINDALVFASIIGALIATKKGGTPVISRAEIDTVCSALGYSNLNSV